MCPEGAGAEATTLVGKRVRIVGDHPHKGASGTITKDPHRIMGGAVMVVVTLDHGDYPGQGCGAGPENLQELRASEDPHA